jgi:hypothetical protein
MRQVPPVGLILYAAELGKKNLSPVDDGLKAAIDAAGGMRALARLLGITFQAIQQWKKVPAERLLEIERVTGVARERLRPDLYRIEPPPRKRR